MAIERGPEMDEQVVEPEEGESSGQPVSRQRTPELPPITRSLFGIARGAEATEEDHRRHLEEKYR